MNKIFKKIWSESRGCFVVVSETASSISRSKGKVTSLVLVTFLTASNVCALTTHNGDVELGTLRDGEKRTLASSLTETQQQTLRSCIFLGLLEISGEWKTNLC